MKYSFVLLALLVLYGCNKKVSLFNPQYYEKLDSDISRLHHLLMGTFVSYSKTADDQLASWNVTGKDSVVLYSVEIEGENQEGLWVYSYEFMTSMPNDPIYTSIKQIKAISKDTFRVFYYNPPKKFKLVNILKEDYLRANIDVNSLKATDKKVLYTSQSPSNFIGKSILYLDKDCNCMRQNTYNIDPYYYKVSMDFYSRKGNIKIDRKKRPNLLLRRDISTELLLKIADKEYSVIGD